jgi:hypothetical protein
MAGRKSVYDTSIKPHLEQIKEWRKVGATVDNICEALNISSSTFFKYLKEKEEFSQAYKKGTFDLCMDLRGELARIAFKHTLETKKVYVTKDDDGREKKHTEITTKEVDGDIAAINLLLKNLDKDWANDPKMLDLKQQELDLRKQLAELKEW